MAYDFLPDNCTGLCAPAMLIPDVDIIPGDKAVSVPSFDYIGGKSKRAIQMISLLVGLGMTAGMATGATGIGLSSHLFNKLFLQLIDDGKAISSTILDL